MTTSFSPKELQLSTQTNAAQLKFHHCDGVQNTFPTDLKGGGGDEGVTDT